MNSKSRRNGSVLDMLSEEMIRKVARTVGNNPRVAVERNTAKKRKGVPREIALCRPPYLSSPSPSLSFLLEVIFENCAPIGPNAKNET